MLNFGLTFDEKTFESDPSGYLEKLLQQGWHAFEFAPDAALLELKTYKQLILKLSSDGGRFSFHVPNFLPSKNFNPGDFGTSLQVTDNFAAFFDLCSWLCSYAMLSPKTPPPVVVLHGAEFTKTEDHQLMKHRTLRFLDWAAGEVVKRKHPFQLAIENAYSPNHPTTCDSLIDIADVFEELKDYPLGLCVDLPHLIGKGDPPLHELMQDDQGHMGLTQAWLKKHLLHIHLHGYNEKPYVSHKALSKTHSQFTKELAYLEKLSYSGLIIHEVLGLKSDLALETLSSDYDLLHLT